MSVSKLMKPPLVSVIIVNYNGKNCLERCLGSVLLTEYPNFEVILVDNASADNSLIIADKLREHEPRLVIIKNTENVVFAEGTSIGIRYALRKDSDYVLLLNNDVIVDRRFLSELVNLAENDEKVGIVGSKIYDYYKRNLTQGAGGYINLWLGKIKTWESGRCRGVRQNFRERLCIRNVSSNQKRGIQENGLLDPYFFFGIEEYDYCIRAKKEGYKIVCVPSSKVWNRVGLVSEKQVDIILGG